MTKFKDAQALPLLDCCWVTFRWFATATWIRWLLVRARNCPWFEEWYLYLEFTWGRTIPREKDAAKKYGIDRATIRKVVKAKRNLVNDAREAWPSYASFEEDKSKWDDRYGEMRPVFWDNTVVRMPHPTDGTLNRITYSFYYDGNVAKGGEGQQLCGWILGHELWTGATSDTFYLEHSGILEPQKQFQGADSTSDVPFTNVTDKGYRCVLAAWQQGQLLLQPVFCHLE